MSEGVLFNVTDHPAAVTSVFDSLAYEIHETAVKKGWYDNGREKVDEFKQLLDRELYNAPLVKSRLLDNFVRLSGVRERNDYEMIALVHGELSEAIEALRKGNPKSEKIPQFSHAEEEFADVIIRMLDQARKNKWNLGGAILAKMQYNKTRPYRHGGKLA